MWDWRLGKVAKPTTELAVAGGASSAFPPVLSPARLMFKNTDFVSGTGADLQRPPFTEQVYLTDAVSTTPLTLWRLLRLLDERCYDTLTTVITGVIEYAPFPCWRTDRSPLKSSRMVVAPVVGTVNGCTSFTSPDGIVTEALAPAGAAMVASHALPAAALSK